MSSPAIVPLISISNNPLNKLLINSLYHSPPIPHIDTELPCARLELCINRFTEALREHDLISVLVEDGKTKSAMTPHIIYQRLMTHCLRVVESEHARPESGYYFMLFIGTIEKLGFMLMERKSAPPTG